LRGSPPPQYVKGCVRIMFKIAVMGEKDAIIGFSALGLDIFPVSSDEQARSVLAELTGQSSNYAIIYLTESCAQNLTAEIAKHKNSVTPAIILIPGPEGSLGLGQAALDESVEKAIGANIL